MYYDMFHGVFQCRTAVSLASAPPSELRSGYLSHSGARAKAGHAAESRPNRVFEANSPEKQGRRTAKHFETKKNIEKIREIQAKYEKESIREASVSLRQPSSAPNAVLNTAVDEKEALACLGDLEKDPDSRHFKTFHRISMHFMTKKGRKKGKKDKKRVGNVRSPRILKRRADLSVLVGDLRRSALHAAAEKCGNQRRSVEFKCRNEAMKRNEYRNE